MYSKEMQTDDIPVAAEIQIIEKPNQIIEYKEQIIEKKDDYKIELSETEKVDLMNSESFNVFFGKSSKIMERALNEEYDFLVDYTASFVK